MAARAGVARRHRSWAQRLIIGLNIFLVVSIFTAGVGYAYLRWRYGQIGKIDVPILEEENPGRVMNVLLVGSDSRARISRSETAQFGSEAQVGGQRSDTIMVLHVDPRERKAAILSVPRDLYVRIAGSNRADRINTAITDGGPSRLISTIQQNLGIRIHHYVEVDFVGFKSIVTAVGGVNMYVPAPVRDHVAGLSIRRAGCVRLDGNQALAWARSRNYEYYESGRWHSDPTGDLGRIQRQQELVRRMMNSAVATSRYNPLQLNRLIEIGIDNVTVDSAMSTKDIFRLSRRFRSLNPDSVEMLTLPTEETMARIGHDTAAVLKVQQPEARQLLDRINGRKPPAGSRSALPPGIKPGAVRVRVLNGTGADGLAGRVAAELQTQGFNVADKGDAELFRYERTVLRYAPGQIVKAQLLQRYLPGGAQLREERGLRTVDVILVAGSDYSGVRNPTQQSTGSVTTVSTPASRPATRGAAPATPNC